VDTWATITTIWQAEGVLMEILDVDATDALLWLTSTAARRGVSLADLAAEVVEHRTI
jgi:AmiR/NasT family two-component response regulator